MQDTNTHDPTPISDRRTLGSPGPLASLAIVVVAFSLPLAAAWASNTPRKGRPHTLRPAISIDNEGPIVRLGDPNGPPFEGHGLPGRPSDGLWLPWRPAIRLDLILPVHSLPDRPRPALR